MQNYVICVTKWTVEYPGIIFGIFGKFRECFDRQNSVNVEIPGKLKGQKFLANAWPSFCD